MQAQGWPCEDTARWGRLQAEERAQVEITRARALWSWTSSLRPELGENEFLFKLPRLRYSVQAAPANCRVFKAGVYAAHS